MYKYDSRDQKFADKMMGMGFYISNNGFQYILDSIKIIQDYDGHPKMTGKYGLYDQVAKLHNTTAIRVERCIRSEVERYYNSEVSVPDILRGDYDSGKLPNTEFLSRMANMFYVEGFFDK